jgi:hypothetical protein
VKPDYGSLCSDPDGQITDFFTDPSLDPGEVILPGLDVDVDLAKKRLCDHIFLDRVIRGDHRPPDEIGKD